MLDSGLEYGLNAKVINFKLLASQDLDQGYRNNTGEPIHRMHEVSAGGSKWLLLYIHHI